MVAIGPILTLNMCVKRMSKVKNRKHCCKKQHFVQYGMLKF